MKCNLLRETLTSLKDNGKSTEDVKWCGTRFVSFTWSKFAEIAEKTDYDDDYGAQEVAKDLMIVGDNWWLEREEYDGAEGWEYKEMPIIPNGFIDLKRLTYNPERGRGWQTLSEAHEEVQDD